jgi:hypothetical protein
MRRPVARPEVQSPFAAVAQQKSGGTQSLKWVPPREVIGEPMRGENFLCWRPCHRVRFCLPFRTPALRPAHRSADVKPPGGRPRRNTQRNASDHSLPQILRIRCRHIVPQRYLVPADSPIRHQLGIPFLRFNPLGNRSNSDENPVDPQCTPLEISSTENRQTQARRAPAAVSAFSFCDAGRLRSRGPAERFD